MPQLQGFPVARQAAANSCWACAGRQIVNWYISRHEAGRYRASQFGSDQKFADQYAAAAGIPAYKDIDVQRSAVDALIYLGFKTDADNRPFPTPLEIRDEIEAGRPLLAIVGDTDPQGKRNLHATKGHWLVIVGISEDGAYVDVFDPAQGSTTAIAYDESTYAPGVYWQNTSYVDPYG